MTSKTGKLKEVVQAQGLKKNFITWSKANEKQYYSIIVNKQTKAVNLEFQNLLAIFQPDETAVQEALSPCLSGPRFLIFKLRSKLEIIPEIPTSIQPLF